MTKEKGKLKLTGIIRKQNGTDYHRVKLVCDFLNGEELEVNGEKCVIESRVIEKDLDKFQYEEQELIDSDIILNVHTTLNNPSFVELYCSKYNCKWWQDIDDSVELPENHVNRKTFKKDILEFSKQSLIKQVACSDFTTTTNDLLMNDLLPFSHFIGVAPNYLPYGKGQFIPKPKEKIPHMITIGIVISLSHFNDIVSIKSLFDKLGNDSEIQRKCKILLCGVVDNDPLWKQLKNIVSTNKNLTVEFKNSVSPEEYLSLFDSIDICLNPLEESDFNLKKSALKLLECSIKGIPMLSGTVYSAKEFSAYVLCRNIKEYYISIKKLIKKDSEGIYEYEKVGKMLSEVNLKKNDFNYRIEKLKIGIKHILENKYQIDESLHVYGITYDDSQYTQFTKYDNSHIRTLEQHSNYFEYNVLMDIVDNTTISDDEYLGIFSYKFTQKNNISLKLLDKSFRELKKTNPDVIGLAASGLQGSYLAFSEKNHPGFLELFLPLCADLGLKVTEPSKVIYSNYFLSTVKFYKFYVNNIIRPAIELLETKYRDLAYRDANYNGLSPEKLKEYTGMDKYDFITFQLERLLSVYLENHSEISFVQLG